MFVDSCASPPALEFTLDINRERQTIRADDNTTVRLNSVQADLVIQLWHYDYSMDVEVCECECECVWGGGGGCVRMCGWVG